MTGFALHKASPLVFVVLLLFALPSTAKLLIPQDVHGVTVVLSGGWEYPDLTVRWSDDSDGLWVFRSDGARRLYRPEELVGIRDAAGGDVTRTIIPPSVMPRLAVMPGQPTVPGQPLPEQPPGEMGGGDPPAEPRIRDWRFLLGIEAGWGKPHDNDFLNSRGGLGVGASVRLQLGGGIYLAGGYDRQALHMEYGDVLYPEDGMEFASLQYGADDGQLRGFWAGLALLSAADGPEAARFYLEGGVGRYEVVGMPVFSAEDAYLGYHAGVGFLIPLGPAIALDLGARGTHVVNLDLGYGDDTHSVVAFRAGLAILAR